MYLKQAIKQGENTNLLLVAPSGLGKTTLAYLFISELRSWNKTQVSGPPDFIYNPQKRFHIFDEVHEHDQPEALYPILDSGRHTFIFATNEVGLLKEPLINRCHYQWFFEPYSREDLRNIAFHLFSLRGFNALPVDYIDFCVDRCNGVPRQLRNIVYRLSVIFNAFIPENIEQLTEVVSTVLNISDGGLNAHDRIYLEFLKDNGRASLDLICHATGITKETVQRIIEPNLVRSGLIRITSRGREIVQ
jgi:Holliday junction resolvasome RuvABC ATP-dependent DNA helicase subunit